MADPYEQWDKPKQAAPAGGSDPYQQWAQPAEEGPSWLSRIEDVAGPVGRGVWGAVRGAAMSPDPDAEGAQAVGQEIGGYLPGVAAEFTPWSRGVDAAYGAAGGFFAPHEGVMDRLGHTAEGAALGAIPFGKYLTPSRMHAMTRLMALAIGAERDRGVGALAAPWAMHYLNRIVPIDEYARRALTNPYVRGRGGAELYDYLSGGGGQPPPAGPPPRAEPDPPSPPPLRDDQYWDYEPPQAEQPNVQGP